MYRWIEKVGLRRAFHTGSPRWQAVAPEAQGPSKKNGFDAQEWLRRVRRSHFAFVFSTRWASFRNFSCAASPAKRSRKLMKTDEN
jgi:hypothetical protein